MILFYIFLAVVLFFGFVVFFGAPYLPTQKKQIKTALDLLDLKPGQTMLELGSGDGRVLRAAAERGIQCIGYELNPVLVIISYLTTLRYRKLVTIKLGNFWQYKWPQCDGIYVFLLDKYMPRLDQKIIKQDLRIRLVSFAFKIPGKKPVKQKSGIFLYQY